MISFRTLGAALLLVAACPAIRGHDPFDITSQARLRPEGIELRLTLESSTARRLLRGKPGPLRPEEFVALRAELEQRAPDFAVLHAAEKKLVPKRVATELTADGDVKIFLYFPPSPLTRLRFDAALLRKLATDGYTVFLLVLGPHDEHAVHERLTLERPTCEIAAFVRE